MFSLSKGEPPTPPTSTGDRQTTETEIITTQLRPMEVPIRVQSAPVGLPSASSPQELELSQVQTMEAGILPAPGGQDSGYEASPCSMIDPGHSSFPFDDIGPDDVFEDNCASFLLEREDDDDCDEFSSSYSRTESSATVRAASNYLTDPNTCDSDSSDRSSSTQSPPPSSWSIPVSCSHIHNDRLPCPRCSGGETLAVPIPIVVASRSYPGSFPASLLQWWTRSSTSSSVFGADLRPPASNRSDDRRTSTRNRRRQIDSDASSLSSCDENSSDEQFPNLREGGSYLEADLGVMTEELRVDTGEQLPDLVQHSSESSSSRRVRSQSLSTPSDPDIETYRQIGTALRRLSNDFETRRLTTRNERRRSSITNFFNWVS